MRKFHLVKHRGGIYKIYEDGNIKVIKPPTITFCPGLLYGYGCKEVNEEVCLKILKLKMEKYGLFTENRVFDAKLFVPFGTSEMIKSALEDGLLDVAVVVCDGAGTVITSNPNLVQAIGARMTGLIKTYPVQRIIKYITENGGIVLDNKASIDTTLGVRRAVELGYKRIGVTVAGFNASEIEKIRKLEDNDIEVTIFVVCTTGVSKHEAEYMLHADVVCSSASKYVREIIGPKAVLQLGIGIPVFILTKRGKIIALNHIAKLDYPMVVHRIKPPYLVKGKSPCPLT